jgi:hypothetical protein
VSKISKFPPEAGHLSGFIPAKRVQILHQWQSLDPANSTAVSHLYRITCRIVHKMLKLWSESLPLPVFTAATLIKFI